MTLLFAPDCRSQRDGGQKNSRSELHFDSSMVEAASGHLRSNISWAIVE
jgi:hypothetical protein